MFFFFFKQKTAYELRISDWSSDVCSSDLRDIGDLATFVPNFSAAKITGFNAASFALRGVSVNNIIVYYEAPVGVLLDDFVMPSVQTQLLDTFDIAQDRKSTRLNSSH